MPQVIYAPQYTNPFAQMLPQFLSQMILNTQAEKFREKMLNQERGFELEKAGFTTQAPTPEGVPEDADYTAPPPKPDVEVAGKGYYAPKLEFQTIPNMPGHIIVKQGLTKQIVKAEDLTLDEKLFKKGLVKVPGLGLFKAAQDESGNLDLNKLTPVATIPKNPVVGSPEWIEAERTKAKLRAEYGQPPSSQLSKKEWIDENGVKWEQDRWANPKTRKIEEIGEPRKVGVNMSGRNTRPTSTPGVVYDPTDAKFFQIDESGNRVALSSDEVRDISLKYKEDIPTTDIKVMQQSVPSVLQLVNQTRQALENTKVGPMAGRWREYWSGKVGSADPNFRKLSTDVALLQTRLMKMHVGARGGQYIMEHFKDIMNAGKDSPENLRAALDEIEIYANEVAQPITGNKPAGSEPTGGHKLDKYWK